MQLTIECAESRSASSMAESQPTNEDCSVSFVIRTALDIDMDSLRGVYRRASLSNQGDRAHLLAHEEFLELSEDGVREERTRVAVDAEGSIIGFASYLVIEDTIELEDLFVDPLWMRQGVGRELVLDVVAIARDRSFERLEVTANPHARHFYDRTGFIVDHMVETQFYSATRMYRLVLP